MENDYKISTEYPRETGDFDVKEYYTDLAQDVLDNAESNLLHIWTPSNMDHMRLGIPNVEYDPEHPNSLESKKARTGQDMNIFRFLGTIIGKLWYRWLFLKGYLDSLFGYSFRDYVIYKKLLLENNGLTYDTLISGLSNELTASAYVDMILQAEFDYEDATYDQKMEWASIYNDEYLLFQQNHLNANKYAEEKILFTPAYPDIILTMGSDIEKSNDSPHKNIPPVITYMIRKRMPASSDKQPFGPNKLWGWKETGSFKTKSGDIYRVRFRRWESLVEFTTLWRSGMRAENLCILFEQFMEFNERLFLEAGIERTLPFGRSGEPDSKLSNSNIHYRKTLWYFKTQEFQFHGPIVTIKSIGIDTIPVSNKEVDQTYQEI